MEIHKLKNNLIYWGPNKNHLRGNVKVVDLPLEKTQEHFEQTHEQLITHHYFNDEIQR